MCVLSKACCFEEKPGQGQESTANLAEWIMAHVPHLSFHNTNGYVSLF
jgi:hypothetical protein